VTRGSRIGIAVTAFAVMASAVSVSAENAPANTPANGKGVKAVVDGQQSKVSSVAAATSQAKTAGQTEVKYFGSSVSVKNNVVTNADGTKTANYWTELAPAPNAVESVPYAPHAKMVQNGILDLRAHTAGDYPNIYDAADINFLANFTATAHTSRANEIFWPGNGVVPNLQTYVLKEIILPFTRIVNGAGVSPDTYLEFTFGEFGPGHTNLGNVGCAANFDPSIDPATLIRIVVATGADTNGLCEAPFGGANVATDDNDVWRINLITGDATSLLDGTVYPGVVIQNNSPMADGSVPVGNGDTTVTAASRVFHAEIGELSGVVPNATVVPSTVTGTNAVCLDAWSPPAPAGAPGGQIWLNFGFGGAIVLNLDLSTVEPTLGEPGFGFVTPLLSSDNAAFGGDLDGILECGEGWFSAGGGPVVVNAAFNGSLVPDCNGNAVPDNLDIAGTTSTDVNGDNIPDDCQLTECNSNGVVDLCDIDCAGIVPPNALGPAFLPGLCSVNYPAQCGLIADCNSNGVPDDCEADCDTNGTPDDCDITFGGAPDCNNNSVPDICDIDPNDPDGNGFFNLDCDLNSVPDVCERFFQDCNANNVEDFCDILNGNANDFNGDGTPDACVGNMVTLDFEDTTAQGDPDYEYVVTESVHDQPAEGEEVNPLLPDDQTIAAALDWSTTDFTGAAGVFTGQTGVADVTAGSVNGGGGVNMLRVFENFNVAGPFAVGNPHIWFASPDTDAVFSGTTPVTHSLSMDLDFPSAGYQVDWDFFVSSIFDTGGNSWRVVLSFTTRADGSRELLVFDGGPGQPTGVDWAAGGTGHNVELVIDYSTNGFSTADAGTVLWDGAPVATFDVRTSNGGTLFMDSWSLQNDANTSGIAGTSIDIDNIKLTWSSTQIDCAAYKLADGSSGVDCDGDGTCDHFQILANPGDDLNTNGILDHCESYCIDCNHNGLPDSFEIADSNGLDMDGNGVLDVCDRLTHSNSFEANEFGAADGFSAGQLEGQQGWRTFLDAEGIVTADASTFAVGSQILIVQDNPNATGADGLIVGPRFDGAGDADIELFAWDMRTTATQGDIGLVTVEILDLCLDAPAVVGTSTGLNAAPFLEAGNGNVGMRLRPNPAQTVVPFNTVIEMLGITSGARQYSTTNQVAVEAAYQSAAGFSAGIEVMNGTGRVRGFWEPDQSTMLFFGNSIHSEGEHVETQTLTTIPSGAGANQRTSGGDRQVLIRISDDTGVTGNGQFGTDNDNQYWFDNFDYSTFADCDFDGLRDVLWLDGGLGIPGAGPANDVNGDGIPDRCQDCDNDCTFDAVGVLLSATSCLDPCELNAAAPGCTGGGTSVDCNANSIPDACDTAFGGLTDNGDPNDGHLFIGHYDAGLVCTFFGEGSNAAGCQFSRLGGGSGDADTNGVPDECQISGGAPDCNENGLVDSGEIAAGTAVDANANTIPDECEDDCNNNGRLDSSDIPGGGGNSLDLFPTDGIPDECCPAGQMAGDLDGDGDADSEDYLLMQECGSQVSTSAVDNPLTTGNPPGPNGAGAGIVAGSFGGLPGFYACGCGDLNGDGIVDECDMQIFQLIVTGP